MTKAQNFFAQRPILQSHNITTAIQETIHHGTLDDILKETAQGQYKTAVFLVNEARFGRYDANGFTFADDSQLDEKYLLELRLFNETEEIYIRQINGKYLVRKITDNTDSGTPTEAIDTESNLFGTADTNTALPNGYTCLAEQGRKIKMTIPTDTRSDHYALKTRSYIAYDRQTGQASIAYYRFVDITASNRR